MTIRYRTVRYCAGLAIGAILAALATPTHAQLGSDGMNHDGMNHGAPAVTLSDASKSYMSAMTTMDAAMRGMVMSGQPGIDFALMMIPHHQAAIDMARAYLESGENDFEIAQLSREIITAQEREIAFLKIWLDKKKISN